MEGISKETHQWAVNVALDSYRNQTLKAGDCATCMIGNMLSAKGVDLVVSNAWLNVLKYGKNAHPIYASGCRQLDALPFSRPQISKIERTFESAVPDVLAVNEYNKTRVVKDNSKEGQYKGLKAVIDLLNEWLVIGESADDTNIKEESIDSLNELAVSYGVAVV